MSTPLPPDEGAGGGPPDDDVLAGELVVGVLDASERRAARARIESDPAFAARVSA
ncbi:MAG: hypothetical protein JOZ67_00410, partial [Gammaproteobacteria bacterium]|nr:hypothetical protein [Gammaproteobacteria bacterium]